MNNTIEKQYSITKEHCITMIHGVCRKCGGSLEPIETEDNGGNPSYWAGCLQCEIFCWGVDTDVYNIAAKLVDEKYYIAYRHMETPDKRPNDERYAKYYRHSQISGACYIVDEVLQLKKNLNSE